VKILFGQAEGVVQWRGQIEYLLSTTNSVGLWGSLSDNGDGQVAPVGPILFEPLGQLNLFWRPLGDRCRPPLAPVPRRRR
jgi:hypothetical protein